MKCKNCGTEIKDGNIYCSKCGHEAQMVPDYNVIDDFLNIDVSKIDSEVKTDKEDTKEVLIKADNNKSLNKNSRLKIVGVCVAIVAILLVAVTLYFNHNNNSYDYQMSKANAAIKQGDHKSAINHLTNAIDIDSSDVEARWLLANEFVQTANEDDAIVLLNEIIKLNNKNYDAYDLLIQLYIDSKNYSDAAKIINSTDNLDIHKKYKEYASVLPKYSHESGSYSEKIELSIEADSSNEIFYTTDGSDPIKNGRLYNEAITLKSGDNIIKSCTKNKYGIYSEINEVNIKLALITPDPPVITPDSGSYSEKKMISISCDDNCTIYYTWDGSDPNVTSDVYSGELEMPSGNNVLSAIAISSEGKMSRITRVNYIYNVDE